MSKQIARAESALISDNLTTTSLIIAEKFGKRHKDVLRKIATLEVPAEYHKRNFAPMVHKVNIGGGAARQNKAYSLTRDGFALLVMGFTGKRAMQWKIRFLEAFNAMEARLLVPASQTPTTAPNAAQRAPEGVSAGRAVDPDGPVRGSGAGVAALGPREVLEWALTIPLARDLRAVLAELARLSSPGVFVNARLDRMCQGLKMHETALVRRLDELAARAIIGWRRDSDDPARGNFLLLMTSLPDGRAPRLPTLLGTAPGPLDKPITWAQLRLVLLDAAYGGTVPATELERLFNSYCLFQEAEWPQEGEYVQ